jgi:hypothetical protein
MSCEEAAPDAQVITPSIGPTMTAVEAGGGIAKVDGSRAMSGTRSLLCDDSTGTVEAYFASAGDVPGVSFGSGDFTVEFHVRFNEANGTNRDQIGSYTFPQREWKIGINANTPGDFRTTPIFSSTGSNNVLGNQELWSVGNHPTGGALLTWHYITFQREGNNWISHADGYQVGSTRVDASAMFNGSDIFQIGGSDTSGPNSEVNYDNIRITKGTARYGEGDFTPPDVPYPNF